MNAAAPPHAADLRHAPSRSAQLFGVFGGAVAWNAQIVASFALATRACTATPPAHAPTWLLAVSVAAIAVTLLALVVALRIRAWARAQPAGQGPDPHRVQRTAAMGLAGLIASGTLLLAAVFAFVALLATPLCAAP